MTRAAKVRNAALFALGGVLLLVLSAVSVVGENEQAVILRMGKPDRVVNRFTATDPIGAGKAGLALHLPFIERVVRLDRALVSFSAPDKAVTSADGQSLRLDFSGKFRVIDPVRLIRTGQDEAHVAAQLDALLSPLLQSELAQSESSGLDATQLAMPGAGGAWQRLATALDAKARAYGVQVVDLRVQRVSLDQGAQDAALARMRDLREGMALTIEDTGVQDALRISSDAEVKAARIIGQSAERDPEFYEFYRAINSYGKMFADPARKGNAMIVLTPDNAYLKQFNGK